MFELQINLYKKLRRVSKGVFLDLEGSASLKRTPHLDKIIKSLKHDDTKKIEASLHQHNCEGDPNSKRFSTVPVTVATS